MRDGDECAPPQKRVKQKAQRPRGKKSMIKNFLTLSCFPPPLINNEQYQV